MTLPAQSTASGMRPKLRVDHFLIGLGWCLLAQAFNIGATSADGDIEQGKKLSGKCKICHGSNGIAQIPIAPNIAGEPERYIVNQLNAYKSGDREHEMMSVVAEALSDEDVADLAKWYSSQRISVKIDKASADDSAVTSCSQCHGIDGLATQQNVPHIAGESVIYLDTQLKAFRSGKRHHEIMSQIAAELTDDQIRKASEWYSGIIFNVIEQ